MKRLFAIVLVITVTLCGCAPKSSDERTLPKCFNSTVAIDFDDTTYEAIMSRLADGWWEVELTAPEAVKGLVFSINGGDTEISFKGLHFTFDTSKFPVGSVVSLAVKSFDRLAPLTLDIVEGDANDFASGDADGMTYSITLDKNGTPLSMELGDYGMKITFVSFEEIEETEEPESGAVTGSETTVTTSPDVTSEPEVTSTSAEVH